MNLKTAITEWDGKSADDIADIFQTYYQENRFENTLIKLISDPTCQKGASWLLKAWLEQGYKLTKQQTEKVFNQLTLLEHWESKLHILQILPYLTIYKTQKSAVENFLRMTLTDNNKFIRAWSYNGFYELCKYFPEYEEETQQFFTMAMQDEAASVKARIRQLMKKGFSKN